METTLNQERLLELDIVSCAVSSYRRWQDKGTNDTRLKAGSATNVHAEPSLISIPGHHRLLSSNANIVALQAMIQELPYVN